GDVGWMPGRAFRVAGTPPRYSGGGVPRLPLLRENGYFPDLDGIPADVKRRAKLLVLNYPNSPTGVVATRDFYRHVVDFACAHDVAVAQDAIHAAPTFQGEPLSFLAVHGRTDRA